VCFNERANLVPSAFIRYLTVVIMVVPLIIFAACSEQTEGAGQSVNSVHGSSGDVWIVENDSPHWHEGLAWRVDQEAEVKIGAASGPAEYLLHDVINAIQLEDNSIAIADGGSRKIRIYDEDGRHILDLGGPGGGPGEFAMLSMIGRVDDNAIGAWDSRQKRLTIFDYGGRVRREATIERLTGLVVPAVGWFKDGSVLITPGFNAQDLLAIDSGEYRGDNHFIRVRLSGEVDTVAVLRGRENYMIRQGRSGQRSPILFGRDSHAAVGSNTFFVGESDAFEIQERLLDGAVRRIIRVAARARSITTDDLARAKQEAHEASSARANLMGAIGRGLDNAGGSEVPHRETLPFFDRMIVDRVQHLWVREFAFQNETQRWQVFDPEGAWLGTVTTPKGVNITDIGSNYVIGIVKDELGVQRVHVHRLHRLRTASPPHPPARSR